MKLHDSYDAWSVDYRKSYLLRKMDNLREVIDDDFSPAFLRMSFEDVAQAFEAYSEAWHEALRNV